MATESLTVELKSKSEKLDKSLKNTEDNLNDVDSAVKRVDKDLNNLSKTNKKVASSNMQLSKSSLAVNRGIAGMGRNAGMAGIQFQQFIGQVQGGQSIMVALSQQSADLGFVLGAPLLGAVAGISASLIGMLVPSLFATNKNLLDVTESSDKLVKKWDQLSEIQKTIARAALTEKLKEQKRNVNDLQNEVNELNTAFINAKRSSGGRFLEQVFGEDPDKAKTALVGARASLEAMNLEMDETLKTLKDLDNEKGKLSGLGEDAVDFSKIGVTFLDVGAQAEIIERDQVNARKLEQQREFLQAVDEINLTGEETQQERFDKEVALHKAALDNKLINEQQFAMAQADLVKRLTSDKMTAGKTEQQINRENLAVTQATISAGMAIAGVAFEDNKAIRSALVIADTAAGITRQFSDLPYPAALATSVAIAANGAVQLAAINSSTKGGGSISGAGGAAVNTAQQDFTPETANQSVSFSEVGDTSSTELGLLTFNAEGGSSGDELAAAFVNDAIRSGRIKMGGRNDIGN